jgi:hypothetical protein
MLQEKNYSKKLVINNFKPLKKDRQISLISPKNRQQHDLTSIGNSHSFLKHVKINSHSELDMKNIGGITRSRSKDKTTDLEKQTFSVYKQIQKETLNHIQLKTEGNHKKSKSLNRFKISGCLGGSYPRTNLNLDWAAKEKWEATKPESITKDLYRSILISKNIQNKDSLATNKSLSPLKNNDSPKNRENFMNKLDTICGEEGLRLNKIMSCNDDLRLPMINDRKILITSNKYPNEAKYLGDRYNPFNFEIVIPKRNTCSIKDNFLKKR